ncbi:glycosyltransferase [Phocaeicola plebeius]|uniref:glycosyltransferase n=1 Tax=Phocaeicola plebeius TaxID=310297 RepID=UPI0026F19285|nr:glycosyltransferase [Phocaeicola plebeius]
MKILLIDVYHYNKGGAETVCFNTGKMLEDNGHEVIYFTLKWNKNLPSKFEKYFPESKETRKGLFRQVINLRNYFYYPDAAKKLEQLILNEKPDIAHIHLMWGQISPSIFPILKKYHIPIIFTVHDYRMVCPAYSFKDGKGRICEACTGKHFYRCFTHKCTKGSYFLSIFMAAEMYFRNKYFNPNNYIDGLLYVSDFARKKHEQYMPTFKNKPNIVLHNFSTSIADSGRYVSDKYFLFLGRLSEEKGIITLMNAMKENPKSRLKIVGSGPLEDKLKEYKKQNKLNNIEFLGYKSGEELTNLKKQAYFVIVPSEWYENNPMAIIESYAEGVPAIGSRIGGIPEIIEEGKTGYTFTPHNYKELAALIKNASNLTKDEYLTMSNNTIEFALKDMSKESYYNKLMPFYKHIIDIYK